MPVREASSVCAKARLRCCRTAPSACRYDQGRVNEILRVRLDARGHGRRGGCANAFPCHDRAARSVERRLQRRNAHAPRVRRMFRANKELHFTIYRAAEMPVLLGIIENGVTGRSLSSFRPRPARRRGDRCSLPIAITPDRTDAASRRAVARGPSPAICVAPWLMLDSAISPTDCTWRTMDELRPDSAAGATRSAARTSRCSSGADASPTTSVPDRPTPRSCARRSGTA